MADTPTPEPVERDLLEEFTEVLADRERLEQLGFALDSSEETEEIKELKVRIPNHPTIKHTKHLELRKTPQRYVAATLMGVGRAGQDTTTHEILTLKKCGPGAHGFGYDFDVPLETFKLEDQEISRLEAFLSHRFKATEAESYLVIPKGDATKSGVQAVVKALTDGTIPADEVGSLLSALSADAALREAIISTTPDEVRRRLSAALNSSFRKAAIEGLESGIRLEESEGFFQRLLQENWWMFGSRYVGRIDRRDYTTDETFDIPLLGADGYVEIIELKRPSEEILKKIGNRWGVTGAVNDAVNQVSHYIGEAERVQDTLRQKYNVDFFKVRGKVVIGRLETGEPNYEEKRRALRAFNSHLHRVEVITYSELVTRSKQLVAVDAAEAAKTLTTG